MSRDDPWYLRRGAVLKISAAFVAVVLVGFTVAALAWGWIFMLIAGTCGWQVAFWPQSCAIGLGVTILVGALSGAST